MAGAKLEHIVMGEGQEIPIIDALEAADREGGWVLVDQIHLASDTFLKELRYHLHRIAKARGNCS